MGEESVGSQLRQKGLILSRGSKDWFSVWGEGDSSKCGKKGLVLSRGKRG